MLTISIDLFICQKLVKRQKRRKRQNIENVEIFVV